MKKFNLFSILFVVITLFFSACREEEREIPPLVIPTTYNERVDFDFVTKFETGMLNSITKMTNEAKKGRKIGVKVSEDSLRYWFTEGTSSLKILNTPYLGNKLDSNWLAEIAKASSGTYTPSATITEEGGAFGGYLFDENGIEIEQLIEKGQYGSVLYNYADKILSLELFLPGIVDRVITLYGANPTFPNTPTVTKTAKPDKFMASYAALRDKNDGKGYYTQMKNAFLKLQAAAKGGSMYNKERNEATANIRLTWEKINAATIINHCHSVIATMSKTTTTDAEKGAALHAYGECLGFTYGWKTVNSKRITDVQIDEILELLNAPTNGKPTSFKFITEPKTQLPRLTQIITKLKGIYGFTDTEIEDFKTNWVAVQGR
jgi:hypothetical protein